MTIIDKINYEEVSDVMSQSIGIVVTANEWELLLNNHPVLIQHIENWGIRDTSLQSSVANLLAQKLLNEKFPKTTLQEDKRHFVAKLQREAIRNGYEVIKNA